MSDLLDPKSFLESQLMGIVMTYERFRPQLAARIDARVERVVTDMLTTAITASLSCGRTPRAIIDEAYSTNPASDEARLVRDQICDYALLAPAYPYFDAALALLDVEEAADEVLKSQAHRRFAKATTELRAWMIALLAGPLLERWAKDNSDECLYELACFE